MRRAEGAAPPLLPEDPGPRGGREGQRRGIGQGQHGPGQRERAPGGGGGRAAHLQGEEEDQREEARAGRSFRPKRSHAAPPRPQFRSKATNSSPPWRST